MEFKEIFLLGYKDTHKPSTAAASLWKKANCCLPREVKPNQDLHP